jgi:hypothetical protein
VADLLNPFSVFTLLYVPVAFSEAPPLRALLFMLVELAAASLVVGYLLLLRRRRRVGDFWISTRAERLLPALFLLTIFAGLLLALALLGAPGALFDTALSMGLAAATVAALTLVWKASAHSAVAGHAAAAGLLVLGPAGLAFVFALPLVLWARVSSGAHTLPQALVGAAVGAGFAVAFLL